MDDDAPSRLSRIWAQGTYRVKPGAADEFARVWLELAGYAVREFGVPQPTILRDLDDANMFVTFGVWDSLRTLERFRSAPFVGERAAALAELIEAAETKLLAELGTW